MLRKEMIAINGKRYTRTWSDAGRMIERDGALYEEAVDPAELGRVYTETNVPIEPAEIDDSEALAIITGGAV